MRRTFESRRWATALTALILTFGARAAHAKKMTLPELLELARQASPGMQAAAAATEAMEAQVSEARRNWLPQGDLLSILAPSPNIHCTRYEHDATGKLIEVPDVVNCVSTSNGEASLANVKWDRV